MITGLGAVTPIGNDIESYWNNVKNGVCGIDFIKSFDAANFKSKVAGEVKNFDPTKYISKKELRRLDPYCQFALAASIQAVDDSEINLEKIDKERFGVIIGTGVGGISTMEKEHQKLLEKGARRISPFMIPMLIGNMASANTAMKFGAKGPCTTVVTACATGTNAIGDAYRIIKNGYADIMITGGSESAVTPLTVAGFGSLTALTKSEDPKRASIPFDKERDGFVIGEGCGVLIIESLEHALKRDAKIYGEIVGYGMSCDAYHITSPAPGGEGAARAMKLAIEEAKIDKKEISYINAHGTSTYHNDKCETEAIKSLFGEYAYKIPVSSIKSMTGHLLGAAGAIEAIACVKALQEGFVPPTIGYKVKDEECDLDYVPNVGRKQEIKYAMSNSLGFGGHNASIIFKRWDE